MTVSAGAKSYLAKNPTTMHSYAQIQAHMKRKDMKFAKKIYERTLSHKMILNSSKSESLKKAELFQPKANKIINILTKFLSNISKLLK